MTSGPASPAPGPAGIRPYVPADRAAVRTLSCDTADGGAPVERFFPDREVVADLLTRYYTDHEPAATWVAAAGGQVAGYLTGCLDTNRFNRLMVRRILPGIAAKALWRGTLLRPQAFRFIVLNLPLWLRQAGPPAVDPGRYPAHFHINLAPAFRARGTGAALVAVFLERLRQAGVPGVQVSVREDNARGRAFFERLGFSVAARHPFMRRPGGTLLQALVCVRQV